MKYFIKVLLALLPTLSSAQSENLGVIIQYEGANIKKLIQELNASRESNISYKLIGPMTKTYLLTSSDEQLLFDNCIKHREINAVEFNKRTETRLKPNDTRINEQYYLNLIKAYDAWDLTTGGKDIKGQEIVIGIVDEGYDLEHEDLIGNILVNPDEIPNDNIDNDNNGYIDDVSGWNTRTNKGVNDVKSHGTYILGVLGAKGNNSKGISGLNWNIKLLPVTTGSSSSDVVAAYDYLLAERKLYNQSGGTKGSNIVVTSYSGGISRAFAKDYPVWCAIYDKLGAEGMLSTTATTNENDNVEVVGDMPSTCTSPYLIVVNSTNKQDEKDAVTGFGRKSVDISAPGEKILTTETTKNGLYKTETGTSLSTPMVAGAIALMYSINCQSFYDVTQGDPAEAATLVKDAIMSSVDKKSSLTGLTVSEGRLNILQAINHLEQKFNNCITSPTSELKIVNIVTVDFTTTITYTLSESNPTTISITDATGKFIRSIWLSSIAGENKTVFDNSTFPSGVYFATVSTDKSQVTKAFYVINE